MNTEDVRTKLANLYDQVKPNSNVNTNPLNGESLGLMYSDIMSEFHDLKVKKPIFDMAIGLTFKDDEEGKLRHVVEGILSSFDDRQFMMVVDASEFYPGNDVNSAIILGSSCCIGALVHCCETISATLDKYCVDVENYVMQLYCFLPSIKDSDAMFINRQDIEEKLSMFFFSDVKSTPMCAMVKLCYRLKRVNYFHTHQCHASLFGEMLGESPNFVSKALI